MWDDRYFQFLERRENYDYEPSFFSFFFHHRRAKLKLVVIFLEIAREDWRKWFPIFFLGEIGMEKFLELEIEIKIDDIFNS